MLIIAENLNTRNSTYLEAVRISDTDTLRLLAGKLIEAGTDMINIQCSLDGSGDEETIPKVVGLISELNGAGICLDTRNIEALRRSIPLCRKPPLINYLSLEEENYEKILSLCRENQCSLIIRALRGIIPVSLEGKLQVIEELIEMANAADIPNSRLFADPSIVHLGRGMGQDHIASCRDSILTLKELVEPPINTISWISNVSTGLHKSLRSRINSAFLSYMAGAGLDAALVDVLDSEIMKTVYLIKSFRDVIIFSQADLEV